MEDHFSFLLWTVQMEIKVQVDFFLKKLQLFYSNSEQYFFLLLSRIFTGQPLNA